MNEIESTGDLANTDTIGGSRKEQAKQAIGQAGQALKNEAQSFAHTAQERALAEAQKYTDSTTRTLGDFANAIRRAGDELGQADQSPASRLVRQAADGLESLSRNLSDKRPEELLDTVRDFGRRSPAAFIGGALLVGVALGRFVRASGPGESHLLTEETGGEAYPLSDPMALASGDEAMGDEALGLAEEDGFDGPAETSGPALSSLAVEVNDDLGDLTPSDVADVTSPGGQRQGQ